MAIVFVFLVFYNSPLLKKITSNPQALKEGGDGGRLGQMRCAQRGAVTLGERDDIALHEQAISESSSAGLVGCLLRHLLGEGEGGTQSQQPGLKRGECR